MLNCEHPHHRRSGNTGKVRDYQELLQCRLRPDASAHKVIVLEFALCEFPAAKKKVLLFFDSGADNSPIALALGLVNAQRGQRVGSTVCQLCKLGTRES